MPHTIAIVLVVVVLVFWMFLCCAIYASRYVKVGPDQVFIISGRKRQLPDGSFVGFRLVRGGGTFVWPVIEKVDVLSLAVLTLEMPRTKARTSQGTSVEADCVAQFKINGDDASVVSAAQHFLGKTAEAIKEVVRLILEKHVRAGVADSNTEEVGRNVESLAAKVQTAATVDLGKMGMGIVSFTIRDIAPVVGHG